MQRKLAEEKEALAQQAMMELLLEEEAGGQDRWRRWRRWRWEETRRDEGQEEAQVR